MDRETIAWALVFSVPVGIGITGYSAYVLRRGVFDPVAILVGAIAWGILFVIVAYAGSVGSADERRRNEGVG